MARLYACLQDAPHALQYLEQAFAASQPNIAEIVEARDSDWDSGEFAVGDVVSDAQPAVISRLNLSCNPVSTPPSLLIPPCDKRMILRLEEANAVTRGVPTLGLAEPGDGSLTNWPGI